MTKAKTKIAAKHTMPPTRSRPHKPLPAERQPTATFDDAMYEMRAAHQRWRLIVWLAHELDMTYGPGDPEDPPLSLPGPGGGQERPIRQVVEDLRGELLHASFRAHAQYKQLVTTPVEVALEQAEPLFASDGPA